MSNQDKWEALLKKSGWKKVDMGCGWNPRTRRYENLPPPTLDNIFKWVVPKLFTWTLSKNWTIGKDPNYTLLPNGIKASVDLTKPHNWDKDLPSEAVAENPAEALIDACYSALCGDK